MPYRPIIKIVNDPGIAGGKPPRPPPAGGGGAGPRSWLIVKMCPVLGSNAIVLDPAIVGRFSSTTKLRGDVSFTTVSVPPPVLKASIVDGLNAIPSDPPVSGNVASTVPSFALSIFIDGGTPAVALTSNKGFEEWGEIFGDDVMPAALVDRLVHHCHIVNIRGNSYRLRQHADLARRLHGSSSTAAVASAELGIPAKREEQATGGTAYPLGLVAPTVAFSIAMICRIFDRH